MQNNLKRKTGAIENICPMQNPKIVIVRWKENGIVTIASSELGVFPLARTERFSIIHVSLYHVHVREVKVVYTYFVVFHQLSGQ